MVHHAQDEAALRQWVDANPGRVNEMLEGSSTNCTILFAAVYYLKSLPLAGGRERRRCERFLYE